MLVGKQYSSKVNEYDEIQKSRKYMVFTGGVNEKETEDSAFPHNDHISICIICICRNSDNAEVV